MNIYISHSKKYDFRTELYLPIRNSTMNVNHQFFLPHELSDEPYPSKNLLMNKEADLVIAEISYPSTGQGIELGWADICHIPVVCIYKTGASISSSLTLVSHDFLEYGSTIDMIAKIEQYISQHFA